MLELRKVFGGFFEVGRDCNHWQRNRGGKEQEQEEEEAVGHRARKLAPLLFVGQK